MRYKIGFTGTREGMTELQKFRFVELFSCSARDLGFFRCDISQFHHGNCIGADGQAHRIISLLLPFIDIHIWPSDIEITQVDLSTYFPVPSLDLIHPAMPPLVRDKKIVDSADLLIAAPKGPEQTRSGTWTTVRYARKQKKRTIVVWPNGVVTEEPIR